MRTAVLHTFFFFKYTDRNKIIISTTEFKVFVKLLCFFKVHFEQSRGFSTLDF